MASLRHEINLSIRRLCSFFTFDLFLGCIAAAIYTGESAASVLHNWWVILTSPSPLVTDYFRLGSLAAAFLNAAVCGLFCTLLTLMHGAKFKPNVWAGYFLVVAHCFYGLNPVNMILPMLSFLAYCKMHKLRLRDNLDWAMFVTSFGPFISEILFRYPVSIQLNITLFGHMFNLYRLLISIVISAFVGFTLPAMMPGVSKMHRGFNLYNGGLATGLLGLFLYSLLYKTMGVTQAQSEPVANAVYEAHGCSYLLFCTIFFLLLFAASIAYGWYLNGKTFSGYKKLLEDTGYKTNFFTEYGLGLTWINLGLYGLMMVAYFTVVILLTDGAGFTGATCGIVLAAMTFSAAGQHPKNVWPILLGYALLSGLVMLLCAISGRDLPWTLSTQGYMNGIAFATGLCPFSGKYGWKAGVAAGFFSAVMCTTTSVMHGGFVLYNGGLTAGIAALILLPILDTYYSHVERYGRGK